MTCKMPDCGRLAVALGFCNTHYRQHKRGALAADGTSLREVRPKRPDHSKTPECRIEGCSELAEAAYGLCYTHASQVHLGIITKNGTQLRERKTKIGSCRTMHKGYVLIAVPNHPKTNVHGYVREHVIVLEQKLGRLLIPGEIVHHVNGIKDDNSPENLELRTTATHEPGHAPDVGLCVETLEYSRDWDKSILGRILTGGVVQMLGPEPCPTGGLRPTNSKWSTPDAGPHDVRCIIPSCTKASTGKNKGMCAAHYKRHINGRMRDDGSLVTRNGLPQGFTKQSHGYILVMLRGHSEASKSGYALVHRVVMSNFLGRPLEKDEVVHHKNGNRADNRLENLQLMSSKENARGYCRVPEQALKFLAATWPAGEVFRDRLERLLLTNVN